MLVPPPFYNFYRFFVTKMTKPYDEKPQINEKLRTILINYYAKDIENLEKLLGKDLHHWK